MKHTTKMRVFALFAALALSAPAVLAAPSRRAEDCPPKACPANYVPLYVLINSSVCDW